MVWEAQQGKESERKFLLGLGLAHGERGGCEAGRELREGKKNNHEQKELSFPNPSESEVRLETYESHMPKELRQAYL